MLSFVIDYKTLARQGSAFQNYLGINITEVEAQSEGVKWVVPRAPYIQGAVIRKYRAVTTTAKVLRPRISLSGIAEV